jgi:hypothetical protein
MRGERAQVHWGAAVTGAFFAVAIAIVLGLFGTAFGLGAQSSGSGGLAVLSAVWGVLTPLVAGFVGAAIAAGLAGRPGAYLNGTMVWALGLAYAGLLAAVSAPARLGSAAGAASQAIQPGGGGMALAGLAAILGFVGALIGSAVGSTIGERVRQRAELRVPVGERGYRPTYRTEEAAAPGRGTPPAEPPELRH